MIWCKLSLNEEEDKQFLLNIISHKKATLNNQIMQANESCFGQLCSQKSKRNDKIELLSNIEEQLLNNPEERDPMRLDNLFQPSNKAFQSFFKEKGGVENIANAARVYFHIFQA